MMKKQYESPLIKAVTIETKDIVLASGTPGVLLGENIKKKKEILDIDWN